MTTLREVLQLAPLVDAVHRNAKVAIAVECFDTGRVLTGTLRAFTPNGSAAFWRNDDDLWEAYVRVSATFEHWFSVRELVAAINEGTAALDYDPNERTLTIRRDAIKKVLSERHRAEGAKRNFKTDEMESYSEFDGTTDEITNAISAALK